MRRRKRLKTASLVLAAFAVGALVAWGWMNRARLGLAPPVAVSAPAPSARPEKGYKADDRHRLEALIKEGAAGHD